MSMIRVKEDTLRKMKVIVYWAATAVIAFELLAGGVTDLVHGGTDVVAGQPVVEVLAHLGYPAYLLTILGVWKLLGGIVLLAPRFPRLKEWAYAGAFFVYTGAAASGVVRGWDDPGTLIWGPLIFAVITLASWALRPQSRVLGVLFPAEAQSSHQRGIKPALARPQTIPKKVLECTSICQQQRSIGGDILLPPADMKL